MTTVFEVFDPAMCCSTGVCGPNVESHLVHFAADLDWLKSQGVEVRRYNLAHQPAEFARQAVIKDLLTKSGTAGLPAIVVNGVLASQACYPSRAELAAIAGVKTQAGNSTNADMTEQTREFIALGAAVGSNCEPCFDFHRAKLVQLGVSAEDLSAAVDIAQQVKAAADDHLRRLIQQRTSEKDSEPSACCGGSSTAVEVGIKAKSKTTCCGS